MFVLRALRFFLVISPISSIVRVGAPLRPSVVSSLPDQCGLFWRLFWQQPVLLGVWDVSCPTTGDRRQKRAVPSWRRSLSLQKCWHCTRSLTVCITTCRGSTTPTCSSLPRLSCCATRRGAACWRSPRAPGLMSPAWVTSPASPIVSLKTTTTTSF